jgi:hypothetical protein
MDTLVGLFRTHPLAAALSAIAVLAITVLPFTRGRFPRVFFRLGSSLVSVVAVPFSFWQRTLIDLASGTGMSLRTGSTAATKRVVPVLQVLLIAGGLLILTAGVVSGWHASGYPRETGQLKSALKSTLPELERTLAGTRAKLAGLDADWEASRECLVEESLAALSAEARALRDENAIIEKFLREDRRTREVFLVLREGAVSVRAGEDADRDSRADLIALGLPLEKVWLLTRFLDNRVREEELIAAIGDFDEAVLRGGCQPGLETLRKLASELPPAIARVREDLAGPDPGRTFDAGAFASASAPAVVLFCAFVWVVGGLIEVMGSAVPLRTRARASVNEQGRLKWAE